MMNITKEAVVTYLQKAIRDVKTLTPERLNEIIATFVLEHTRDAWEASRATRRNERTASYFSLEYLIGRCVQNNLISLGLYDLFEEALEDIGADSSLLEEVKDCALGNGGLGRLAACFLDSAATEQFPVDGYGLRYRYGYFTQGFRDGAQYETADDWTRLGDPWSMRCEADAVTVHFADRDVLAVPYDMPIYGYDTFHSARLRLWQAEAQKPFDFQKFDRHDYYGACEEEVEAENITRCLYPNDDTREGKRLRLRQQYFLCSASLQDILRAWEQESGGADISRLHAIQLNDTHPVISIPEFLRLMMQKGFSYEDALREAKALFFYTNHTVMPEALETWDTSLVEELLPEVYRIILRLDESLRDELYQKSASRDEINRMRIVQGGVIRMANMAVFCARGVNGVSAVHTEILKNRVLADWYRFYPERFRNITNGVTQRRWLAVCNRELSALLTERLGTNAWIAEPERLAALANFAEDEATLTRFREIKTEKKRQLAEAIYRREPGRFESHDACLSFLDPEGSVFDVQIKRMHEYKRQLLNAFSILYLYYGIKDGSLTDLPPVTFLFGAKAAPGYRRAKAIIRYINAIADKIAADPEVNTRLKVFFVADYDVSYAEKLVAAADISEQISTAGTEASGTGNMKLMLNGAVTLGTYDGANIEIFQAAGEENNYPFGARVEELTGAFTNYDPRRLLAENEKLRRVVTTLLDGSLVDDPDVRELYTALTDGASWHVPDHYYVLGDFESYLKAKLQALRDYQEKPLDFAKKQWQNLAHAGGFSSDRAIFEYASSLWHLTRVKHPGPSATL